MRLRFVAPDQEKTFGNMTFAGVGTEIKQNINNVRKTVARTYYFYSDIQKSDVLEVRIPGKVPPRFFEYEQPIKFVRPKIDVSGYVIKGKGYTNYVLSADDIVPAEDYELLMSQQ